MPMIAPVLVACLYAMTLIGVHKGVGFTGPERALVEWTRTRPVAQLKLLRFIFPLSTLVCALLAFLVPVGRLGPVGNAVVFLVIFLWESAMFEIGMAAARMFRK